MKLSIALSVDRIESYDEVWFGDIQAAATLYITYLRIRYLDHFVILGIKKRVPKIE